MPDSESRTLVSVWTADPRALEPGDAAAFARFLDAREHDRLSRFRFREDADAFTVAHALKRVALAELLRLDPSALRFADTPLGQPRLAGSRGPHFSLSRSRHCVALAISMHAEVGIDVEPLDPLRADPELLEPFLAMRPVQSARAFYEHWTALEAFWKCVGTGLSATNPRLVPQRTGSAIDFRYEGGESAAVAGRAVLLHAAKRCALAIATRGPAMAQVRHWHAGDAEAIHELFRSQRLDEPLSMC